MSAAPLSGIAFRTARPRDAEAVAALHADSWRRHYRGAYSDAFLDGDVAADRYAVWSARFAATEDRAGLTTGRTTGRVTLLAEDGDGLTGFVHVVFDDDERWGSLLDNLHVAHRRRRTGIGRALLTRAAREVAAHGARPAMYLWVLQQNTAAQEFYRALGATPAGSALVGAPGGVPGRLAGAPRKLRMTWPELP